MPFNSLFQYKYQINIDGTVAAYRFPYLLAGDALVFKQNSKYYEHFYKQLEPGEHYIPFKSDLSDLVDRIHWAKDNDAEAQRIARTGQKFAQENLMPQDVFCYHAVLFKVSINYTPFYVAFSYVHVNMHAFRCGGCL
jgi:hypothetical protein